MALGTRIDALREVHNLWLCAAPSRVAVFAMAASRRICTTVDSCASSAVSNSSPVRASGTPCQWPRGQHRTAFQQQKEEDEQQQQQHQDQEEEEEQQQQQHQEEEQQQRQEHGLSNIQQKSRKGFPRQMSERLRGDRWSLLPAPT